MDRVTTLPRPARLTRSCASSARSIISEMVTGRLVSAMPALIVRLGPLTPYAKISIRHGFVMMLGLPTF